MERNLVLHQGLYIQHSCSTNEAFMVVPTSEVGSKETDETADEVLKLDILDCWTPENHYRWSKSKCSQTFRGRPSVVIFWRPTIQNILL